MDKKNGFLTVLKEECRRFATVYLYFKNGDIFTGLYLLCSPSNIFQLFPMLPLVFGTSFICDISARLLKIEKVDDLTRLFSSLLIFLLDC